MTALQKYLKKKRNEVLKSYESSDFLFLSTGFDHLISNLCRNFDEVTPVAVRKAEMLEALLVAFVKFSNNIFLLNDVERVLKEVTGD